MGKKRSLSHLWSNIFMIVIVVIEILLADDVSYAATPTDLSIKLMACPSSPVPEGARVMLTAKVTSAAATGQMQFTDTLIETTDGSKPTSTDLGTVSLPPNGTASLPTEPLQKGTHTLTATFTPTDTTSFKTPTPATIQLVVTDGNGPAQTAVSQKQSSEQSPDPRTLLQVQLSGADGGPVISVRLDGLLHALL